LFKDVKFEYQVFFPSRSFHFNCFDELVAYIILEIERVLNNVSNHRGVLYSLITWSFFTFEWVKR